MSKLCRLPWSIESTEGMEALQSYSIERLFLCTACKMLSARTKCSVSGFSGLKMQIDSWLARELRGLADTDTELLEQGRCTQKAAETVVTSGLTASVRLSGCP